LERGRRHNAVCDIAALETIAKTYSSPRTIQPHKIRKRVSSSVCIGHVKHGSSCHDEIKEKKTNADSVNTTGMELERMLFCVLHHSIDAETHNILPGE